MLVGVLMGMEAQDPRARLQTSRVIAFALPAALLSYYALRGGSYDSVVWQEEALVVWWVLGLGVALGLLPRRPLPRGAIAPLAAFGLLVVWTAVALAWTESAERTYLEVARVTHYAGVVLGIWLLVDRRTRTPAAYGLAAAAVLICAVAVGSRLAPGPFPPTLADQGFPTFRLNYPLDYWNALAAWAAMSIAMALAISAHAARAWTRAAFLAAVPVCGLTAYLTYSRGGLLAGAIAVGAVIVLSRNRWVAGAHALVGALATAGVILVARGQAAIANGTTADVPLADGAVDVALVLLAAAALCATATGLTWVFRGDARWRLPRRVGRIAAAAGVIVVVAATAAVLGGSIARAWDQFRDSAVIQPVAGEDPAARLTSAGGVRYPYWVAAFRAFEANPLTGVGPGTYEFVWNRTGDERFARDAHSLYLEHLAEGGIPAALLVLALVVSLLVVALKARFKVEDSASIGAVVATTSAFLVFAVHAGIDWLWEVPAVTCLALAGVAVASAGPAARAGRQRKLVRAAVVAVAVLALLLQLPSLVADSRVRDSQQAFQARDLLAAQAAAKDAVEAEPWAASPYVQRALLAESVGRLEQAKNDALLAVAREPTNWRHHILLARIDARLGNREAAIAEYEEARRLRPGSAFLRPSDEGG